ncbi:MAG: TetR/AcrR family transcriptional regulator [Lachnospiraceae bacterium]
MNDRFYELPEEKQLAIFNASMEVFGENDYKRASTDLIAKKAGISKGMLFYYFHNKKELFLQTYDYVSRIITEAVADKHLMEITDFFELITYAGGKKIRMLERNPHIMDFSIRAFFSQKEEVTDDIHTKINYGLIRQYTYFANVDFSKFREGVDQEKLYHMLVWMTDGYLHTKQMTNTPLSLSEIEKEYEGWVDMFKKIAYKEEFQ